MRVSYVCLDPGVPVFGAKGASVHVQTPHRKTPGKPQKNRMPVLR